jgi:hypothetical protein
MKYTGSRSEAFETLKISRRSKAIDKETYDTAVRKLNQQEKAAQARAAAREAKEDKAFLDKLAQQQATIAVRKIKAKEKRTAKRKAKADERIIGVFRVPVGTTSEEPAVIAISNAAKGIFQAVVKVNGVVRRRKNIEFTDESASLRHQIMRLKFYYWEGSSGDTIFDSAQNGDPLKTSDTVEVILQRLTEKISPKPIGKQKFAEGIRNCVAEPLARIYDKKAETSIANGVTKATIKKEQQRARACRNYGLLYPDGIPEGEPMERMGQIARRRIIIHDVMSGVYTTYNEKCPHIARFTNTREGHVDVGHISFDDNPEIVTAERLQEIIHEHGNQHFLFEGRDGRETAIRSARGCWAVANPVFEIYKRQADANGIGLFGIDAVRYPKVNKWLHSSVVIQAAPVQLGEGEIGGHIDMEKAYIQHSQSSYYRGFPAKIHQWRRLSGIEDPRKFVVDHFGLYRFQVKENPDPVLRRLGLTGNHILPGPELLYYIDRGLVVELLSGVFCSSFNMTWTPEMFEAGHMKDGKEMKLYADWSGCLSYDRPTKEFHFKGTREWADHLASLFGVSSVRYIDGKITLTRPKAMNHTKHHILAFITAYLRINTLEAIRKVGEDNVIGVQMDGIFHKTCEFEMPSKFRDKEYKDPTFAESTVWFDDKSDVDDSTWPILRDERLLSNCVLSGQGGSGKTYFVLTREEGLDSPWNDLLYVVPQHDLGQDKKAENGANYATVARTAGENCQSLAQLGRHPSVVLLDELTMVEAMTVDKLMVQYPHTLFFVAGDIEILPDGRMMWFQCRNGKPGMFSNIWRPPASWGWKLFTDDWRSKDEQLKALKLWLRDRMRENFTDGGNDDAWKLMEQVIKSLKVIVRKEAVAMFKNGEDTWIAGTNAKSVRLAGEGVVSGWVCRAGEDRGNKSFVEVPGWEKRGSFTTHSFQGQTVKKGKLFVSINDAFEHAMIYTAISRATSFDQIILVS